ncbi:sulfotransferase [Sphingomonas sp.]|uniref:tetratricopeptide repeat-containing sulfotransferase family protein n=1 Tax=Sphingomonas sp. TaxID=28214 RepID=UPI00286D318F|nr:sulfotransferase [Sphingomonas sp.]
MQRRIIANPKAALAQARQLLASDPAAAEAQARNLLAANPDHPATLRVLGGALRRLGKLADARVAEHRALEASTRNPGHRAAAQALQSGDAARAHALLRGLLADDDSDVLALTMLGLQAANLREFEIAEPLLRRAVAEAPDEVASRTALAELFNQSKRPALALAELDSLDPEIAGTEPVQSLRAEALSGLGRLEEELAILERLAAINAPHVIRYGLRIGHVLRALGREEEAIAMYRAITSQHPAEGTSWWSLANLKTFAFDDADIATMEAGLAVPAMPVQNLIRLNFALGKAYEDRREAQQSFAYYAEGNRLRTTIATYDPLMIGEWTDRNIALFTAPFFAARAGHGAPARDPIFIIGMQRSGSTLVEQILASHPAIEGTAELNDIPNLVRQLGETAARANQRFEDYFPALDADQLCRLGETYLDTSRISRTTDRALFTDKMPNNWMQIGLIHTILPNARIIDVRRDPMSCCFSNWKQLYARGLDHSNTLETMGRYYADYVRLMRHFDAVTPGLVHRVIYDDLVDDVEGEVRRLLAHLDVPFDPACLSFHSNARAVRTISAGQVRKPINRDGIGQWQMFEQWLDPLKPALGDTLENWRT